MDNHFEPEKAPQEVVKDARKQITRSAVFAIAALVVIVFACYAWFVSTNNVSANIGGIQMLGGLYELAGKGTNEEAEGYGNFYSSSDTSFEFNKLRAGDIFKSSDSSFFEATGSQQSIRWRLVDSEIENFNKTGIRPGSSGTLSFYVIPKVTGTLSLDFTLDLTLLDDNGNQITDATAETLNNLIKGHLLFSLEGTGNSKWVSWDGNTFSRQFGVDGEDDVGKPQLVTLHWMWARKFKILVDDTSLSVKIPDKGDNLFYSEDPSAIPGKETIQAAIANNQLDTLSELYDRADRYIGSNLTWLEVKLSAQLATTNS